MKITCVASMVFTLLLFALGPLLAQSHVVPAFTGFAMFAASALPGVLALILGTIAALRGPRELGVATLTAGMIPIAVMGAALFRARHYPPINDIATDLDNPPAFTVATSDPDLQGTDLSYPPAFKSVVRSAYPTLMSLQIKAPPDVVYAQSERLARSRDGWTVTRNDPVAMLIEGHSTFGLFQFTDDFVIRVQAVDGGSQVDMRSRSRTGKGDMGANAQRIRAFFAAMTQELTQ